LSRRTNIFGRAPPGDPPCLYKVSKLSPLFSEDKIKTTYCNQLLPDAIHEMWKEFDVEFDLPESTLNSLLKAMAVLKYSEVAISGSDGNIYLETVNTKNPSSDTFKVKVGATSAKFKVIIKENNLKLISDTYKVKISKKGLAELQGKYVTYWVATEASSVFE
jgi:hypothetical protein